MADVTWTGATDGDMSEGTNWDTNSVPTASDNAIFAGDGATAPNSGTVGADYIFVTANTSINGGTLNTAATGHFFVNPGVVLNLQSVTVNDHIAVLNGAQLSATDCTLQNVLPEAAEGTSSATVSLLGTTTADNVSDYYEDLGNDLYDQNAMIVTLGGTATVVGYVTFTVGSSSLIVQTGTTVGTITSVVAEPNAGSHTFDIAGAVTGNITLANSNLTLQAGAVIDGNVSVINTTETGNAAAVIINGGTVHGTFTFNGGANPSATFADNGGCTFDLAVSLTGQLTFGTSSSYSDNLTVTPRIGPTSITSGVIGGSFVLDGTNAFGSYLANMTVQSGFTASHATLADCTVVDGGMTLTRCSVGPVTVSFGDAGLFLTNCQVTGLPVATYVYTFGTVHFINASTTTPWNMSGFIIDLANDCVTTFFGLNLGGAGFEGSPTVICSGVSQGAFGLTSFPANTILTNPNYPTAANVLSGIVFANDTNGTYVPVLPANVLAGTLYGANAAVTGTLALPTVAQVLAGISFGAAGTQYTGTYTPPNQGNVRSGTTYGATGSLISGLLVVPAAGNVRSGTAFGEAGGVSGTLALPAAAVVVAGTGFGTAGTEFTGTFAVPAAATVLNGTGFGAAGTQYTGTVVLPDEADVLLGVTYGPASSQTGTLTGGGGEPNTDPVVDPVIAGNNPPAPIVFLNQTTLQITAEETATVYYTLDGRDPFPLALAFVYTAPVVITSNAKVKAVAVRDGLASKVIEATFARREL